ncbi:STAS domain-containing protein [Streptomyces bohaiensis]|uniref:STAS domain-containing protein n=1 Tax=Streptomyces bohaiensis TaxID=1431344 RepID=UPI003B7E2292
MSSCAASVAVTPETFLITTTGALDLDAIGPFEDALSQAAQSLSRCTVLDLSRVTFADSTCLNVLLAARVAHAAARRPWAIAGPYAHQIRRLLAVTGADRVLPLAPDLPAARRLAGYPDDEGPGTAPVAAA